MKNAVSNYKITFEWDGKLENCGNAMGIAAYGEFNNAEILEIIQRKTWVNASLIKNSNCCEFSWIVVNDVIIKLHKTQRIIQRNYM